MKKSICENGGCLSKLGGNELISMLRNAKNIIGNTANNKNIQDSFDDCAIVNCNSDKLLLTTDINHPVGHDPFTAGRIAAFHAISDVYAMGGTPKYAIAQVVLGENSPTVHGEQYMAGLYSVCNEEGVVIVGGHTIISDKPIIGLSIIGYPAENNIVFGKKGGVTGDTIWISKPIGTAMALRAYYNGLLPETAYNEAIEVMTRSNSVVQNLIGSEIHALTDVTGFGLLGHLAEMLVEGQSARISIESIPFISGICKLPYLQLKTKFIDDNFSYFKKMKQLTSKPNSAQKLALFDPQTNGALLAIAHKNSGNVLINSGFVCIGEIIEGGQKNEIHLS